MTIKNKKDPEAISVGGQPVYRYGEPTPWREAALGAPSLEQIGNHIVAHLGKSETVFHEIASDAVHIDVHLVAPAPKFPFVRLVTSGMSDLPMSTPDDAGAPRFAELISTLPGEWPLDQESLKNEVWYWPIRLLKSLARFPHLYNTWLGSGHSIPNGDPPRPYANGTKLCGAIILPPVTAPSAFHSLVIDGDKTIEFFSVVPLYEEEMNLKLRSGSEVLLKKLVDGKVFDIINPSRANVAKKKGWMQWM